MARVAATVIAIVLFAGMVAAERSQDFVSSTVWRCRMPPTEPCFTHRGRLSGQNGIAYKIWLVGTKRVVRIDYTEIPDMLEKYLSMTSPDHMDVYGDFDICPLERDRPGQMRAACVAGAIKLAVQDRDRSRPPVRLLSTWPQADADQRSPLRLDSRIPPADPAKYDAIREATEWKNPKVTILANGVLVWSDALEDGRQTIEVSELGQVLVSLPVSAWPYGRVVLASHPVRRRARRGTDSRKSRPGGCDSSATPRRSELVAVMDI